MINFLKGLFGYNPHTDQYSTTETITFILIGLVVVVTIYILATGGDFQYYTDLLMYAIGGASGNKIAKGAATTVQKWKNGGGEDE
jgi:hypothetical protein